MWTDEPVQTGRPRVHAQISRATSPREFRAACCRKACSMTKLILYALAICASGCISSWGQAHVPEPAVNLGDTSFLDALGGPGWLLEEIGDGSHSGMNTSAANSVSGLTHIAWLSNRGVFHSFYGVEVVFVAAHVNAGAMGSAGGFGDLTVSPLIFQFKEKKFGRLRIDQRIVADFDLPVGEYRQSSDVNLSSHAYTVHPYYAATLFPTRHLETSWRVHYLWNSTNHAPPEDTGARSTQAGQAVHFNATAAYGLPHGVWVGANGYFLKQVTSPEVNGVPLSNSPEQVGAIGPGVVWDLGRCLLYANGYHEVGAENRPQGNKIVLRVQWIFGK
jgi:hypothetical protein